MGEHSQKQVTNEMRPELRDKGYVPHITDQVPVIPVRAVAHLKEKTVIKGFSVDRVGTEKVTGDIVWNTAGTWPEGVRVQVKAGLPAALTIAYTLVPMGAIKLIEVLK